MEGFAHHPGRHLRRWGTVRIRQLRIAAPDDGHAVRLIHTDYGQGYVLRAPESEEDRPTG